MGHNIEQGSGGLTFVEIQRFCGICPKAFETDSITFRSCWDTCGIRLLVDHYSFLHTIYRSPSHPPTPINVAPTKTHQTRREMGHNIEQGAGGLTFVEIQRFCGICSKTFETDCLKGNERHI